jgi:hypothetical protein
MGVPPLDLQQLGIIRCEAPTLRASRALYVYWNREAKTVHIAGDGRDAATAATVATTVKPDCLIRESLADFYPRPFTVASCVVYERDGAPSLPMNAPNDLLACEWSDFACDGLIVHVLLRFV